MKVNLHMEIMLRMKVILVNPVPTLRREITIRSEEVAATVTKATEINMNLMEVHIVAETTDTPILNRSHPISKKLNLVLEVDLKLIEDGVEEVIAVVVSMTMTEVVVEATKTEVATRTVEVVVATKTVEAVVATKIVEVVVATKIVEIVVATKIVEIVVAIKIEAVEAATVVIAVVMMIKMKLLSTNRTVAFQKEAVSKTEAATKTEEVAEAIKTEEATKTVEVVVTTLAEEATKTEVATRTVEVVVVTKTEEVVEATKIVEVVVATKIVEIVVAIGEVVEVMMIKMDINPTAVDLIMKINNQDSSLRAMLESLVAVPISVRATKTLLVCRCC